MNKLQHNLKQQKYWHYHQTKLINMNILGESTLPLNQNQMIELGKFTYSRLEKAFEK